MGKKEKTFEKIVEAAMKSYSIHGDRGTTFQTIADIAKVSQPLVSKYFGSRENVLPIVVEKFLGSSRTATVAAVEKSKSAKEKLKAYIKISIQLFRDRPEIFKVYLLLHYHAGFEKWYLEKNTEIKRIAVNRVKMIIDQGIQEGVFKKCNSKLVAKVIHSSLVGVVIGIPTEVQEYTDTQIQKTLEKMVFSYLQNSNE